ncbi:hypothetical protein F5B20DRAFT_596000 [Whalleya microplaca]|nr:hypothetical protein F5B20DRAFT_596000 [Whalleya microplaca]
MFHRISNWLQAKSSRRARRASAKSLGEISDTLKPTSETDRRGQILGDLSSILAEQSEAAERCSQSIEVLLEVQKIQKLIIETKNRSLDSMTMMIDEQRKVIRTLEAEIQVQNTTIENLRQELAVESSKTEELLSIVQIIMSSLTAFRHFPNLPNEIQLQIWQAYILDYNKSRLVLVAKSTRRIILTPFLACPAFSVNIISRVAAKDFYPVQLPVFHVHKDKHRKCTTVENNSYEEDSDNDGSETEDNDSEFGFEGRTKTDDMRCGILHINFDMDTFLLEGADLDFDDLCVHYRELPSLCWTSPLTSDQCKLVKNIMEFQYIDQAEYFQGWHSILPIEDLAKLNYHCYDKNPFRNVKSCHHFYIDVDDMDEEDDISWDARTMPRPALLEKWCWASHFFNSTALKKKPRKLEGYLDSLH